MNFEHVGNRIDDELLKFTGKQESQFLIHPNDLYTDVVKLVYPKEQIQKGLTLPWSKTHKFIRLHEGKISLWAGINSHGKSALLGQVAAWGLHEKWLIASMEMKPAETVERMVYQVAGNNRPPEHYIKKIIEQMNENLWLYDQTDTVSSDRILALTRYAAQIGIKHVIIDSLMKCGIVKSDLDGQTQFVDRLCWLAKSNNIHVHLVHHIRKTESEKRGIPGKFDIRGAGEITDLVDNVFIIYRNKRKEEKDVKDVNEADTYLCVEKQRGFSWEGKFKLFFNKESGQFTSDPNRIMHHWINE